MLTAGELEAFATNKASLFEMSDQLSGSHVLDGRWGLENFAIGIPKGREVALALVSSFVSAKRRPMAPGASRRAGGTAGGAGTGLDYAPRTLRRHAPSPCVKRAGCAKSAKRSLA